MKTTLYDIRKADSEKSEYEKLLKGLNKSRWLSFIRVDKDPLDIETILKISGIDYTCWILDKVLNAKKELFLFAIWNAKNARKEFVLTKTKKWEREANKVLNTVNLFAHGKANEYSFSKASNLCTNLKYRGRNNITSYVSISISSCVRNACGSDDNYGVAKVAFNSACTIITYNDDSLTGLCWDDAKQIYTQKAENKLIEICNGKLPAMYKGKNHF